LNLNARSLLNKVDALESILLEYNPEIVTVTETWLHPLISDSEILPPDYIILRKNRLTRGGGVAIILKRGLSYVPMPEVKNVESLWCKVSFENYSIDVGVVYRPPDSDLQYLHSLYDYMLANIKSDKIIMTGDINMPEINWDSLHPGLDTADVIIDMLFAFNLTQIVREPTRVQGSSRSLLDVVFLSDHFPWAQTCVEVVEGISDHKIVVCTVPVRSSAISHGCAKYVLDFYKADDASIQTYLAHEFNDFQELYDGTDISIDELWQKLKSIINHCITKFIPSKRKMIRKLNPWISREIIHLKRKLKRLRKSSKKRPLTNHNSTISELSRLLKLKIKEAKHKYYNITLHNFVKASPQKFWNHIIPTKSKTSNISASEIKILVAYTLQKQVF
ncbi:uncharacterized protein LOC115318981, partial [Ixodes scapularis]|uniref:uncharacterized protein LOC115318981 n=1 Tax=Ixodes scapularis TaxID=6945 RepID=UPI001A9F549B